MDFIFSRKNRKYVGALRLLDRADALVDRLPDLGQAHASGQVVRSDVLRVALLRGLASLEAEVGLAKKATKPRLR